MVEAAPGVEEWTLTDSTTGVTVRISALGATITSVLAPDQDGVLEDVVLGYDDVERWGPTGLS